MARGRPHQSKGRRANRNEHEKCNWDTCAAGARPEAMSLIRHLFVRASRTPFLIRKSGFAALNAITLTSLSIRSYAPCCSSVPKSLESWHIERVTSRSACNRLQHHLRQRISASAILRSVKHERRMRIPFTKFPRHINCQQPRLNMLDSHPRLPPFTRETAIQKVRAAENGWNSCDPERVSLVYTPDSFWRIRQSDRRFHWDRSGPRPAEQPGLSELGL